MESEIVWVKEKIEKTEVEIQKVEEKIEHVEILIGKTVDEEEKKQLRDKEKQLRDKEKQLRDEKKQLRDEKKELYLLLREKELAPPSAKKLKTSVTSPTLPSCLEHDIGAPSSFGRVRHWEKTQKALGDEAIKCHRSGSNCGNHVSLYYKGFDTFSSEFGDAEVDKEDCVFTLNFCWSMAKPYRLEVDRMSQAKILMDDYFQYFTGVRNARQIERYDNMDGAIKVGPYVILIVVAKNEIGSGGGDSYMQAVAYYHQHLQKLALESSCAPCILIELVGPHIAVSGAVCAEHILVDRLTPFLWCVPQRNDRAAMIQLARCFKALKNAIYRLEINCELSRKQPRFPFFETDKFTYEKEIKNNVFLCHDNDQKQLIIKFVETYGIDAHRFMEKNSYAPCVLDYCEVTSRYHAVVMDYIPNAQSLTTFLTKCCTEDKQKCKDSVIAMVREMHIEGYCHGDLRGNNILVQLSQHSVQKLFIIDFDWAGKLEEQRYPYFMNHAEIKWPAGACDNKLITSAHDLYWIDEAFR